MNKKDTNTIIESTMELTFFMHQLGGRNNIETLILRKDFYNGLIKENLIKEVK